MNTFKIKTATGKIVEVAHVTTPDPDPRADMWVYDVKNPDVDYIVTNDDVVRRQANEA